jgi:hypothetical protein
MERIEFPRKGNEDKFLEDLKFDAGRGSGSGGGGGMSKIPGVSNKVFGIIKFILGLFLLPMVYAATRSFLHELSLIESVLQRSFWLGVVTFVITYLFVYEPAIIYRKGHRLVEIIFSFFAPLVKVAPFLLPVYTVIIFVLYLFASLFVKSPELMRNFLSLFGFSAALHLVFSAKSMRAKQGDFFKANYIFGFSFIYLLNITLIAVCLNLIFDKFSLVNFMNMTFKLTHNIYSSVFTQLFVPK